MASGLRWAYATTVPFGRHFGVVQKFEIIIANRSLVLMSATPFAVRTRCRCWIAAFGSRYTRPAAVDTTGAALLGHRGNRDIFRDSDSVGLIERAASGKVGLLLYFVSIVSVSSSACGVYIHEGSVVVRTQLRWSLMHCLRRSIESTCWFVKRVPRMTSTGRESATTNGIWNIELTKRARMSSTPRSRWGRPFASPSRGTVSFRTWYRFHPANRALFRIKFGPGPVSNTAENGRRLR